MIQPTVLPIDGQYEAIHLGLRFQRTALLVTKDMLEKRSDKTAKSELQIVEKILELVEKAIEGVELVLFFREGP